MAIDRNAALKQAEKLLRQGKLDGAIQEYVRLVEDQPRDWNAMNALGDLYARAGNTERAVEQFTRVADHLFGEGFLPKAAALYKKTLKTQSDHEPSLLRLGEIAALQGLVADTKLYLGQLARQRRARGDERGANECLVRLGALDDPELKLAGARAARALNDSAQATVLFGEAAEGFEKHDRRADALDALVECAQLDTAHPTLRARVARACVAAGQIDRARLFLTRESAGDDPDLLLAVGRMELDGGSEEQARAAFSRLMVVAPSHGPALVGVAEDLLKEGRTDAAYGCVDVVTETALVAGDLEGAFATLQFFLRHGPHVPALLKLVEIAVDAGRADLLREAQGQLGDAYLDAGRGPEARVIAEDLMAHDPTSESNVGRLRRALALAGVLDAEAVIARYVSAEPLSDESFDLDASTTVTLLDVDVLDEPELIVEPHSPDEPRGFPHQPLEDDVTAAHVVDDHHVSAITEVDLSEALGQLSPSVPFIPPAAVAEPAQPPPPPKPIESFFEGIRSRAARDQTPIPAGLLERGLTHLDEGRFDLGISDLQSAARAPMLRFTAAARLGRLYASRGEFQAAVEWFERAAEAPPPSSEESIAVLYELAEALERMGEAARALAILIEIDSDAGAYLDVRERIEQLTRAQAGSRGL